MNIAACGNILAATVASVLILSVACGPKRPARAVVPKIGHTQKGIASWYGVPYHGRRAANGEIFDMEKLTAAHRTFAFGTWVRVLNLDNGKSVDVRITDRGPFIRGRIVDLSRAAAGQIAMIGPGLANVRLEVIPPPASLLDLSSASVAGEKFAVQIGAFRDRANAERRRAEFEKEYGVARIVTRDAAFPLWRVLVGEFEDIEDADRTADRIKAKGADAFTVRLDEPTKNLTEDRQKP